MARKTSISQTTTTRVTHSLQLGDVLDLLASIGLLGSNRAQVAHTIIVDGIARMQKDGLLPPSYAPGATIETVVAAIKNKSK